MSYQNMFSLEGKGIVVTGGAGYLGSKIAECLQDFGAYVIVADMADGSDERIGRLRRKGRFSYVKCDLMDADSVKQMYEEAESKAGSIDVLFNCAAYTGYAGTGDADEMSDALFEEGIKGTLGLTYCCVREVVPFMREKGGSIINFGSLYALIGPDFRTYPEGFNSPPNYGAGKAAIVQLTRHCASQFAKYGIRVNCMVPGSFPHPATQKNTEFMDNLSGRTMLGRIGYPDDLLGAAVLLASDASSYMTGSNVIIDGGTTAW